MSQPRIEVRDYFTCERCGQIARCVEMDLLTGHTILCVGCLRAALAAVEHQPKCGDTVAVDTRRPEAVFPGSAGATAAPADV